MKKNIIIIGARGYLYHYGGWETFVTNLIKNNHDENYTYYVPNLTRIKEEDRKVRKIDHVISPNIYISTKGFLTMFLFTIKATRYFIRYIRKEKLQNVVVLELGCKVGPFFPFWHHALKKMGASLVINPDGLEWKREKWSWWIRKCFKISERYCIKYSDYCVCDSKSIEKYIHEEYPNFKTPTKFIAFGAYENLKPKKSDFVKQLWKKYQIKDNEYYLIVGRFVPENNYEVMIQEFLTTDTQKDLVIICNVEENEFYKKLLENTHFDNDPRVKFIGTVYEEESLIYIRQHAYAYLHGHSVGGTNPSLLEALSNTKLNILYDVCYNREVGENSTLYFTKEKGSLKKQIEIAEKLSPLEIQNYERKAKARIHEDYTWSIIDARYKEVFEELLDSTSKNLKQLD